MIDRYLLRYFLAVIDCGSFSKAAKQLNVAQPTLSVGIGKLERLLGASLFQRTSKRRTLICPNRQRCSQHARCCIGRRREDQLRWYPRACYRTGYDRADAAHFKIGRAIIPAEYKTP